MSSSNDINDEEPTSTLSSEKANISTFKMHIAHNCLNALLEAQLLYFKQLNKDTEEQTSNKKRKTDLKDNEEIPKVVENQELSIKRQEQLEEGMCLAFVCAGIPFNVAGNEIVHAWFQNLEPGFKVPSPKTLARRIFNKQIIQVEAKMESELQSQYRTIAIYASTLWKAFGKSESTCQQLLGQLASYKENEPPFDVPFEPDCQTPQTWWKSIEDIHRYYITHAKEEISYIDRELTLEDVLTVANGVEELDDNDSDEGSADDETEFESLDEVLNLEKDFDLNHEVFWEEGQSYNIEPNSENVVEEQPNYDYNVDSLVDEILT
ncbi:5644_t:CDS:2 [Racocetra fulgida]|uniref:5644_t:CDS:1 n=1 Tax=Racocetra fulgida TaxID=60492 RepID=A0A9N9A492_9GLOM|nr:5644_t:CDS:2 [Racocetra fulgida]